MDFLYALESIRTPFLDELMLLITHLGDEYPFLIIAMFLLWCVNKYQGYYMLFVGFVGVQINQLLKVIFRIERPWVLDKKFKPVEGSIERATGYSFPSGHTQSAVGTFCSVARWCKNNWLRIVCVVVFCLVAFSRMYLGVHTPKDVITSMIIASALVFLLYPIVKKAENNPKIMYVLFVILTIWSIAQVVFMHTYPFPQNAQAQEIFDATKTAYKMLGATVGLFIVYIIDSKYIKFPTKAAWWAQLIKLIVGLLLTVGVQKLCYVVFELFVSAFLVRVLAYFIMVLFAGLVWPLTFKWFAKTKK